MRAHSLPSASLLSSHQRGKEEEKLYRPTEIRDGTAVVSPIAGPGPRIYRVQSTAPDHCAESPDPGKTALGSTRGDRPEHRGKLHGILRCIDADGGIFSHIAGDRVPVLQDPELFQFLDLLKLTQREPGKLRQ